MPPYYELYFPKEHLDAGSRHGSQAASSFSVTMAKHTADGSYPHFCALCSHDIGQLLASPPRARSIMHVSTCSSLHMVVAGWLGF